MDDSTSLATFVLPSNLPATLVLEVQDSFGCVGYDTVNSAFPITPVFAGNDTTFCFNDEVVQLSGASPAGGYFTGTLWIATVYHQQTAGIGTHSAIYTFTDANGCTFSDTLL